MKRILSAISLLALACANAHADDYKTYEGTVGNAAVVLNLEGTSGDADGSYFYRSTRFDIDLWGNWKNGSLSLESRNTGDKMTLHADKDGLSGELKTAKGKRLPVALHPAGEPASLPADLPTGLTLYQRHQLAGLSLAAREAATVDGKAIRWFQETTTGLKLFRLEEGSYEPRARDAINAALARNQWNAVSQWYACLGGDGKPGMDGVEVKTKWLGADYVSYVWHSNWSCAGAAHPDFGDEGHSYDAHTGKELTLDEMLPFGKGASARPDSGEWLDYRTKMFGPAVVALLKKHYPKDMAPPTDKDEGCDYGDPEVWSFPAWSLGEKGLWLGAGFARAARVCDNPDWSVLPWADVRKP